MNIVRSHKTSIRFRQTCSTNKKFIEISCYEPLNIVLPDCCTIFEVLQLYRLSRHNIWYDCQYLCQKYYYRYYNEIVLLVLKNTLTNDIFFPFTLIRFNFGLKIYPRNTLFQQDNLTKIF